MVCLKISDVLDSVSSIFSKIDQELLVTSHVFQVNFKSFCLPDTISHDPTPASSPVSFVTISYCRPSYLLWLPQITWVLRCKLTPHCALLTPLILGDTAQGPCLQWFSACLSPPLLLSLLPRQNDTLFLVLRFTASKTVSNDMRHLT